MANNFSKIYSSARRAEFAARRIRGKVKHEVVLYNENNVKVGAIAQVYDMTLEKAIEGAEKCIRENFAGAVRYEIH